MNELQRIEKLRLIYEIKTLSRGYHFKFLVPFTNDQLRAFLDRLCSLKYMLTAAKAEFHNRKALKG